MPNIKAVNFERHASRRWLAPVNYAFCAQLPVVNISATEMQRACVTVPIAFVKSGETWSTCAILGVPPSTNLCVLPDGRWAGPFLPAALRAYPFSLHQAKEADRVVLCIDEEGGLAAEGDAKGHPFFGDGQEPAPLVKQAMDFLTKWHAGRIALEKACTVLDKHKLIVPWTFSIKYEEKEKAMGGLFRIDEQALVKLDAKALHELMQSGAIALAYAQMISMQHLPKLADWAQQQAQGTKTKTKGKVAAASAPAAAATPFQVPAELATPGGDLNLDFLNRK